MDGKKVVLYIGYVEHKPSFLAIIVGKSHSRELLSWICSSTLIFCGKPCASILLIEIRSSLFGV
ncbi:hypothetical protein JCM18905_1864 [Vibrio sp. JCM 18905]|nr:hypothetical protein JCM18905_1864 [Vibrio sp. JCM 18905]